MEILKINDNLENQLISEDDVTTISRGNFIEANTEQVTLYHLKKECIIPVYSDNESTISHAQFIDATKEVVNDIFFNESVLEPNIRVSHVIRGRVPSAIGKPVKELRQEEKTIYWQRLAFMIEVDSIKENVNNNDLSLVITGVRGLNKENLYSKRKLEHFQVAVGFVNHACCNLCLSTDGLKADIKVASIQELKVKINELIQSFDRDRFLGNMERLDKFYLSELQFANLVGKMKMYQHLSIEEKADKISFGLNDNQISTVVKEYFTDQHFSRDLNNEINLYKLYNLLTSANKSSYIDSCLSRNAGAFEFVTGLADSLQNQAPNWFVNQKALDEI